MKYCPKCKNTYPAAQRRCASDGEVLSLEDPYHLVGRVLADKYRIDALVGVGGFGAVYSAYHLTINRHVAFKILLPHLALGNDSVLSLFEREAQVAGQLFHENIVNIYDAGRIDNNLAYIVMEWLEGRTLDEELAAQGPLEFARASELLRQIAAALSAAHAKRIVHRDLKPSNIMLATYPDGSERVKVLDFGIAKVVGETTASPVSVIVGTPHYASPEQFRLGGRLDERSDLYSLGIMLYQMLTGVLPFQAATPQELIGLQQSAPPPPLALHRPDAPAAMEQLISLLLEKEPNKRPQRAAEVAEIFERATSAACGEPTLLGTAAITSDRGSAHLGTDAQLPAIDTAEEIGRITIKGSSDQTGETVSPAVLAAETIKRGADSKQPQSSQPVRRSRRGLLAAALGILALVVCALAYQWLTRTDSSITPVPASVNASPNSPPPQPEQVLIFNYYLEVKITNTSGSEITRNAGVEPLNGAQSFKFHFTSLRSGYLYIVAPNRRNQPMTFLTARPLPSTGVVTNRIEAGIDYSFPAGTDNWLGITPDESLMAFTVVFSPAPLAAPGFLAAGAGRDLTATEQHELTLLREQLRAKEVRLSLDSAGQQSQVFASVPGGQASQEPIIADIPVRLR